MGKKTIIGDVEITGALTNNGSPVGGGDVKWSVITQTMTNAERLAALQKATLPYVIFLDNYNNALFLQEKDGDYLIFTRAFVLGTSVSGLHIYKVQVYLPTGGFNYQQDRKTLYGCTDMTTSAIQDNLHIPSVLAVIQYVANVLKIETLSDVSSGDTIPAGIFWLAISNHKDVELNGARLHYMNDDGTNYEYGTMTMNGANIHLNLVQFNKTTHVVTFNTADIPATTN